jgi:hypothetical protein
MSIVDAINKLITERGSAEIMSKHLAFIRDQVTALEKENLDLKKQLTELKDLTVSLTSELRAKAHSDELVEHRGVLFKRNPKGGYLQGVYCPHCKGPMATGFSGFPYQCTKCKVIAVFTDVDLQFKVMRELDELQG